MRNVRVRITGRDFGLLWTHYIGKKVTGRFVGCLQDTDGGGLNFEGIEERSKFIHKVRLFSQKTYHEIIIRKVLTMTDMRSILLT